MERSLAGLKDHLIVCGYGRMGRLVCREFSQQGLPFVIIDREAEAAAATSTCRTASPCPATPPSDEVLKRAGVERARALVTVAASDADNLYITMSARLLNDKLFIVARAEGEQAEQKLLPRRGQPRRLALRHRRLPRWPRRCCGRPWWTSSSWPRAPSTWICRSRRR